MLFRYEVITAGPNLTAQQLDDIEAKRPVVVRQIAPSVYTYVVKQRVEQ